MRAFEFGGGLPELVIPDNEPELNPTYQNLAMHYGVAMVPARVRKPRDKAKVEAGVQLVQHWSCPSAAPDVFSLGEFNRAIRELLERPLRKRPGCRRSLFEGLEQPVLRVPPAERFT